MDEDKFTKEQILGSKQFSIIEKDILQTLLNENEQYSIEEVKEKLKEFNEKEVN